MKTLTLLTFILFAGMILSAQDQGPIPKIGQQITTWFSSNPREKVFLMTDKVLYKPGETIWLRAFVSDANNQPISQEGLELFVKLYNKKGTQVLQDIFRLDNGSAPGDIQIPEDFPEDNYFLVAYTSVHHSPEEIACIPLKINPEYTDQWVVETVVNDSISISGQKNEIFIVLRDVSGNIQKNTSFRYQFINGTEIIEKGKIKTDANGKTTVTLTIPDKTNGEPFTCLLSDSRDEWKHEVFLPTNLDPVVIKFYPEGGTLIPGTPGKIGFTAFNKWGMPVDVEGSVLNQEGKSISLVKTFTPGLGLVPILADGKQKYKLLISGKTGQNQSFELPAPDPGGLSLSVVKTDAGFISANLVFADKQKHSIALMVTRGASIYWAADMDIDGVGRIKVPAENLPQGINLLSVFSKEGNLLAERIVFTDKNQQLNIEVTPEKLSLQPNESMKVKVRLTDENNQPLTGNVAIAVSDKFRNQLASQPIDEYLMIGSELETPFSIIAQAFKNKISNSALMDVFLIANRTKGFNWDAIMQFKPENAPDQFNGNNVPSGVVTDKNGTKMNKAKVSLVNNKTMQMHTTTTNSNGFFSFPNLYGANAKDFTAKATDPEGKRELLVTMNPNFEAQVSTYLANNAWKYHSFNIDRVADQNYFSNNQDLFSKAPKLLKPNTNALDNQRKLLANSTNIMDVIKTIKPYKIVNNQIVFIGSENSINYQGGALLVLDGQQLGTDISIIQSLSTIDIDHINVSTNPMDIQRYTGLNSVGVIEIFQKKGPVIQPSAQKENKNQYEGGFRISNVFQAEPTNPKQDFRTTLQWIPEQKADESGLIEFSLTTGKVLSDFMIEVQGISPNGRIGHGSAGFTVKNR
ncbi:MAG: MG2 domain-containing protein [Bacteroidota bacterium]|nr:MG2 domain-containing protein [Bacteroidota bacterium]